MRIVLAAVILLLPTSTAVLSQDDPMEAQRCIMRCLEASGGAVDPAYNSCVRQTCNGSELPEPSITRSSSTAANTWKVATGVSYPAVVECAADNLCLFVSCPSRRSMALELYAIDNAWEAGDKVAFRVGATSFNLALPQRNSTDMYRWNLSDRLNRSLRAGSHVEVRVGEFEWAITLVGSSAAISSVENRCR